MTDALFMACKNGHESCARLLIEKGADASKTSPHPASGEMYTALMVAQAMGHAAICALLEG